MDSSIIGANANFTQNINFKGSDTEYSAEIVAQDVTVNCGPGTHNHGSSKVKLTNVVDYQWELRYYIGQLIAIHVNGKIIAYGVKGKSGGMVRVTNTETNQRALIKDIKCLVQDVSFALTPMQIILGCVDEEGNLYVYNIEDSDNIICTLLLHVVHPRSAYKPCTNYRVIWCPYVPSFGEDSDTLDDPAKLLVLLNGNKAEVWDVSVVNSRYGVGPLQPHDECEGFVEIGGHSMEIIDASFSPDGTAIATASLDGYVKFFQVYMVETEQPRCLHQWKPHEGKALSCLLFLDNVNAYGTDSKFWKFAVTGANCNAELKIWSCESWTCLQTIRFQANPKSLSPELFFKVKMDMTATYLLTSDINNRILYVLQIHKNEEERLASVITISEFLLPAPFMSYCIVKASVSKCRYDSSDDIYREDVDDYDEENNIMAVSINMYTIQPKRLQECTITFQPEYTGASSINPLFNNTEPNSIISNGSKCDDERQLSPENNEITKLDDLQSSVTLLIQQQTNQAPLNLMTPDDFNSPVLNTSPSGLRNSLGNEVSSPSIMKKSLEKLPMENVENLIDFQQPQKDNFASGGSSPSREVQEILALNNPTYNAQEYFDNLTKMDNNETENVESNNFNESESGTDNMKNKEVVWPNIPTMKAIEIQMKEENRRKELHIPDDETENNNLNWNKAQLQALNCRINSLENLIREQNSQIQKLQHDLVSQSQKNDLNDGFNIRNIFSTELELAFNQHQLHMTKLIDTSLKEHKRKEREQVETMFTSISQKIIECLQDTIQREIKTTVLPPILAIFDNLQHQLDMHYSQKINTIDQLLKTNIAKLFNNPAVTESLSSSIINVIKPSLEQCYKEMISVTLIPSWEKICNSMFVQIHNTFTQGTKEYTSSVESYMDRQRRVQDKGKDLIIQMETVSESMQNNTEKLLGLLSHEIQKQFNVAFTNLQETLIQTITEQVKEQVKVGFKTHAAVLEDSVVNAVRSRAVTPSPHVIDTQVQLAQIQNLIAKGNIDIAFQQALSASASISDLSLVLHVCEKVNPAEVFGQGTCLLQQHVLLSLIQQLGADLNHHTEVKLKYLEEALLNLEPTNSVTKEHIPSVLRELSSQLSHFISGNPTNKYLKSMKMLLMATQSILKS